MEELLGLIARELQRAGIPGMLTGSTAAAFHGVPRATMDIDFVIEPERERLDAFMAAMNAAGLYGSAEAARDALERESMFNIIDPRTGWKADMIIRKSRAFSREEFERRRQCSVLGHDLDVVSLEDLIIAKLEWASLGESKRQLEDVASLLRLRSDELEEAYLSRWVRELGLDGVMTSARRLV